MVRAACLLFLLLLPLVGCSNPAAHDLSAASPAGHEVRLWQDAHIFELVARLLGSAHRRVLVEVYELGRAPIVRQLGEAATRGVVEVRVITDPTVKQSRRSVRELDALGVAVRTYPVDDKRHQIDHVKLLIADDEAVVGGMNWGVHSDRNHDYVLETRIAVDVDRLVRIFDQDWAFAGGHPAPPAVAAAAVAQTSPGAEIRTMVENALNGARHRILAEVYTLTDPEVIAELVIAHRGGVLVRVILDPNQAYNFHAFAVLHSARVEVRWYPVPKGALLHAKIGLFDGELVLGSANWTLSGFGVNHELDIETSDAAVVTAYLGRFDADWALAYD